MGIVVRKSATGTTASSSSDFGSGTTAAPGLDDSAKGTRQASGLVTVAKALPSSGIDGTDFTTDDRPSTQSVGIVFGRTGIGKTTFVCSYACRRDETQPGRELVGASSLALINLDGRSKYAVDDARARGRTIYHATLGMPDDVMSMTNDEAKRHGQVCLDRLIKNLRWAAAKARAGEVGVICIDTCPYVENAIKLAVRGRVDRPANTKEDKGDFGKADTIINLQLTAIIEIAKGSGANVVLLDTAKPVWEGHEPTGRFTFDAHKKFSEGVDWIVELRRSGGVGVTGKRVVGVMPVAGATAAKPKSTWELEVLKAGADGTGQELFEVYEERHWAAWQDVGAWQYLNWKMYPKSVPADWQ